MDTEPTPGTSSEGLQRAKPLSKALMLYFYAQEIAHKVEGFYEKKGPGLGDRASADFMKKLRGAAEAAFGQDYSERKACKKLGYRFDFYFPEERTVVEVALGLHNPISEYERDIFKCLLAREEGIKIDRLCFICKPGGADQQGAPGPSAIASFVGKQFQLEVTLLDLMRGLSAADVLKRLKPSATQSPPTERQ
jgi:hypothetical protein